MLHSITLKDPFQDLCQKRFKTVNSFLQENMTDKSLMDFDTNFDVGSLRIQH